MASNDLTGEPLLHRDPTQHYPVAVRGEGIYLYDADGRRYVDGTAGATNVTLGHGRAPHRRRPGGAGAGVGLLLFDSVHQ